MNLHLTSASLSALSTGLWNYNFQIVLLGVISLGIAAGLLGCFLLFRKRSLLSDTIGHSTLPGVAIAFIISQQFDEKGKSFLILLFGGLLFGWLSVVFVDWISKKTKTKEDGALAISLTVFYAIGAALLSVIQKAELPNASGLEYYLFGMVASMVQTEAWLLFGVSVTSILFVFIFLKELNALCFDEGYVSTQGLPHKGLDQVLMLVCLIVAIVGLQTVGLLLIMALFIIPPATARLWTNDLKLTLILSALCGAIGGGLGAFLSAEISRMPAGAAIILASAALFFISLLFGSRKGLLVRWLKFHRLERKLQENQFLRAVFDSQETQQQVRLFCGLEFSRSLAKGEFNLFEVMNKRNWKPNETQSTAKNLSKQGALKMKSYDTAELTNEGLDRAIETAKTHRLTELYLLEHAEIAPRKVHQYVEKIEEITTPDIAQSLRALFENRVQSDLIPPEPHEVR